MANITPKSFSIEDLTLREMKGLYDALKAYVYQDGSSSLEGEERLKFMAVYEIFTQLNDVLGEAGKL